MSTGSSRRGGENGGAATEGVVLTWHGSTSLHLVLPAWHAVQARRTEGALAVNGGQGGGTTATAEGWGWTRTLAGAIGGASGGRAGERLLWLLLEVGVELLVVLLELLGVDRRRGRVLGRRRGL